jgi:hypothetical protein
VADPNPVSAPKPPKIERVKSGAAILAAVAGAITGLWGVYEKVRTEAKDLTAASYNTLAPQMNQIGEALRQLQQENQQLREIVAQQVGKPRIAAEPPAAARRPARRPASGAGQASNAGSPVATPPANQPAAQAPASGAPAAPATAPPAAPPPAEPPAAPPASAGAPPEPQDPVTGLLNTVGRTREAIEGLRKVPETFENVLGKKK